MTLFKSLVAIGLVASSSAFATTSTCDSPELANPKKSTQFISQKDGSPSQLYLTVGQDDRYYFMLKGAGNCQVIGADGYTANEINRTMQQLDQRAKHEKFVNRVIIGTSAVISLATLASLPIRSFLVDNTFGPGPAPWLVRLPVSAAFGAPVLGGGVGIVATYVALTPLAMAITAESRFFNFIASPVAIGLIGGGVAAGGAATGYAIVLLKDAAFGSDQEAAEKLNQILNAAWDGKSEAVLVPNVIAYSDAVQKFLMQVER